MMSANQKQEIGIGVIGLGERMRGVVGQLLEADSRIQLRAVSDPSQDAVDWARARVDQGVEAMTDHRRLSARPDVDWVMVGSWNCFHAEQVLGALEAGKHVFCEKPMATCWDDCLRIRAAVTGSPGSFFFGLVLRYSPHYQRVYDLVMGGRIGRLVSFEFNETLPYYHGGYIHSGWRRHTRNAGSHMLEKCCHDLDLANWIAGSRPTRVASFGGNDVFNSDNRMLGEETPSREPGASAYGEWRGPDSGDPFSGASDILDNQVCILEYANGVRATFHTNANAGQPERRFYLVGTEGSICADAISGRIELQRVGAGVETEDHGVGSHDMHAGGDAVLVSHLADCVLRDAEPKATVEDALQVSAAAFAIDRAVESGEVVALDRFWEEAGHGLPREDHDGSAYEVHVRPNVIGNTAQRATK